VLWIGLIWLRTGTSVLVNTVMNLRVTWNFGKFLSGSTNGGFSRRAQLHVVGYFKTFFVSLWPSSGKIITLYFSVIFPCCGKCLHLGKSRVFLHRYSPRHNILHNNINLQEETKWNTQNAHISSGTCNLKTNTRSRERRPLLLWSEDHIILITPMKIESI
jgi:hypothetical protein